MLIACDRIVSKAMNCLNFNCNLFCHNIQAVPRTSKRPGDCLFCYLNTTSCITTSSAALRMLFMASTHAI